MVFPLLFLAPIIAQAVGGVFKLGAAGIGGGSRVQAASIAAASKIKERAQGDFKIHRVRVKPKRRAVRKKAKRKKSKQRR